MTSNSLPHNAPPAPSGSAPSASSSATTPRPATRRVVDAATRTLHWLMALSFTGAYKRVREAPPQDRITQSAWFERKHRDIEPAVWKRTSIGSRANCMACHTRADQGDFDDDRVRIPK